MRRAFLSYCHADAEAVHAIQERLTSAGIVVWMDRVEIKAGDRIPDRVGDGISSADYFLVVLTKNALKSRWLNMELNIAVAEEIRRGRRFVVPILAGECSIPPIILDKAYVDLTCQGELEESFDYLVEAVLEHRVSENKAPSHVLDRIFIIAGPTSAGKDALLTEALEEIAGRGKTIEVIPKYTTRPPRYGEKEGEAGYYIFRDYSVIKQAFDAGDVVWMYPKYGHFYGIQTVPGPTNCGRAYVCVATVLTGILDLVGKLSAKGFLVLPVLITAPERDLRHRLARRHLADLPSRQRELGKDLRYLEKHKNEIGRIFKIVVDNSNHVYFEKAVESLVEGMLAYAE